MPLKKVYRSVGFFSITGEPLYPDRPTYKVREIQDQIDGLVKKMGYVKDLLWGCQNRINDLERLAGERGLTAREQETLNDFIEAKAVGQSKFKSSTIVERIDKLWEERDRLLFGEDATEAVTSTEAFSA